MRHWGKHLIVNAHRCGVCHVASANGILAFNSRLLQTLDMKPFGKPFLEKFGEEPHLAGYTLIQPIYTSSITAHFAEQSGDAYLDIFSCKWFDEKAVERLIQDCFNPLTIDSKVLMRDANERMM